MAIDQALAAALKRLGAELDRRTSKHNELVPYDEGGAPIPQAVIRGRMSNSYRSLMPSSEAPWGSLIVDSKLDRLEVAGIRDTDESVADACWEWWQENAMDSESKLALRSSLLDGRSFALIWPNEDGQPEVSLDDQTQMVVEYVSGSRRKRVQAMRRWVEGDTVNATLYRRDGIYKFSRQQEQGEWNQRQPEGEDWPVDNPYDTVPVVEIPVNRKLRAGSFAYARGEYEHCTGLMDRINLLTYLGLVVAVWMGFPLTVTIGEAILKDDDGKAIPPFERRPDSIAALENKDARLEQLPAADRKNLSIFAELDQLAAISKTARHYFPIGDGISNIAEPTIRAFEGGMHAAVTSHKSSAGEGFEEVNRVAGMMLPERVELSPRAELVWKDHESRSLAERADAAVKLASIPGLPWQAVAERALNATSTEINRWEADLATSGFGAIVREALTPTTPPVAAPDGVPAG